MIWSKLTKTVESLMANSVKGHLQVHFTRYGSGNTFTMNRAWSMFDRRLGKRRLRAMHFDQDDLELKWLWYRLRCEVEEIIPPEMH